MTNQFWIEAVGDFITVQVRGLPTEDLIRECHEQVLALARQTGAHKVLYDARRLQVPEVDVPFTQCKLIENDPIRLRRAIVVPDSRLAYLARLAFGDGEHQIFYDEDLAVATHWLRQQST